MTPYLARHPLCLTPLSPIHVGCGEDLDWTSAVLDEDRLLPFDPLAVRLPSAALAALDRATAAPDAGRAIIQLQQIFRDHREAFVAAGKGAFVWLPPAIAKEFHEKIGRNVQADAGGRAVANQLRIDRIATSPGSGRPVIPGSSVKGMLRTAEIARIDGEGQPPPRQVGSERDVEGLVGRFEKSTFSKLALSDFAAIDAQQSLVVVARNVRRKPKADGGDGKGLPVRVEVASPFVAGAFRGDLRILGARSRRDNVASPDVSSVFRTAHQFHHDLFAFFRGQIGQDPDRRHMQPWLDAVGQLATSLQEGRAALVRIGKFGSAESKTVAHRRVRIPQAKTGDPFVLHPYTMWLADPGAPARALPFGWAVLELADEPTAAVREFCTEMAGRWSFGKTSHSFTPRNPAAAGEAAPPPRPRASARIVEDRAGENRSRLGLLEDQHELGREYGGLLEATIKQSTRWADQDRLLLARLVRDKLRADSRIPAYKWRDLEKFLPKLPE